MLKAKTIIAKYSRARDNAALSQEYFDDLDRAAPQDERDQWKESIEAAEKARSADIEVMDYMLPRYTNGATFKEIEADMAKQDSRSLDPAADNGSITSWLVKGLKIEDSQFVSSILSVLLSLILLRLELRQLARKLGAHPTADQRLDLERKRQRLAARIREFHSMSGQFLGANRVNTIAERTRTFHAEDGNISDTEIPGKVPNQIENTVVVFPSSLVDTIGPRADDLRARECRLRRARANDALRGVRESLGHLSFQYVTKVRHASTNQQHLRSYQGVKLLNETLNFHQQRYNECRAALLKLDERLQDQFPYLLRADCVVSKMITELNAPGQSNAKLAWFWGATDGYAANVAPNVQADQGRMLECEPSHFSSFLHLYLVI